MGNFSTKSLMISKEASAPFNNGIFASIAKKNVGQEQIFDMIVKANKKSFTDDFLGQLNAKSTRYKINSFRGSKEN